MTFSKRESEFVVLLKGNAELLLLDSIGEANEVSGLEMFAMASAVVARGEQLRGKGVILFLGNNAAAGALISASSKIQMISAFLGRFRG